MQAASLRTSFMILWPCVLVFGTGACHGTGTASQAHDARSSGVASPDKCGAARSWRASHSDTQLTYEEIMKYPVECSHTVFGIPPDRCDAAHTWVYEHHGAVMSYDELLT